MTREELEESIRWEAGAVHPVRLNEVNLDFQILRQRRPGGPDGRPPRGRQEGHDRRISPRDHRRRAAPGRDRRGRPRRQKRLRGELRSAHDEVVALVNVGSRLVNINILAKGAPAFTRDISRAATLHRGSRRRSPSAGRRPSGSRSAAPPARRARRRPRRSSRPSVGSPTGHWRNLPLPRFFAATAADSRIAKVMVSGGGCACRASSRLPGQDEPSGVPPEPARAGRVAHNWTPICSKSGGRRSPSRWVSRCGRWRSEAVLEINLLRFARRSERRTSASSRSCSAAPSRARWCSRGWSTRSSSRTSGDQGLARGAPGRDRSVRPSSSRSSATGPRSSDRGEARGDRSARALALGSGPHARGARAAFARSALAHGAPGPERAD